MILVIDDEPSITELLTDMLENQGFPVVVAHSAEAAFDILPLGRPEAIFVDLMMPAVDGLSLALALRHDPHVRTVPLVAMSASDSALALAGSTGDFDACIRKPFEHDEVVKLVRRYQPLAS